MSEVQESTCTEMKLHCMICLDNNPTAYVHGPCDHVVICGPCYLINKMKYEKNTCIVCTETLLDPIILSVEEIKEAFSEYHISSYAYSRRIGCYFHEKAALKEYESMLSYTCPQCHVIFQSIGQLKSHAQEHKKEFCNICLAKRKVFPINQRLYSSKDITRHRLNGDPAFGSDGAIPAHIKCSLCRDWSYDRDDYVHHMLMSHMCCQLCKRRGTEVWLSGQNELIKHYIDDHLTCDFDDCRAKPLENVFEDELSLKSHILCIHGQSVSKQERKAAATLNLDFSYGRIPSERVSERSQERGSRSIPMSSSSPSLTETLATFSVPAGSPSPSFSELERGPNGKFVVMKEIEALLGREGLEVFRDMSIGFCKGQVSAAEYYEQFCLTFLRFPIAPLLWIEIVSSLPDFKLREQLYYAHHEAVRNGRGLNRVASEGVSSVEGTSSTAVSSNSSQDKAYPRVSKDTSNEYSSDLWSTELEPPPVPSHKAASSAATARPKPRGPMKGKSVWQTMPTTTTATASVPRPIPSHLNPRSDPSLLSTSSKSYKESFPKAQIGPRADISSRPVIPAGIASSLPREVIDMLDFPSFPTKKKTKASAAVKSIKPSNAWVPKPLVDPVVASAVTEIEAGGHNERRAIVSGGGMESTPSTQDYAMTDLEEGDKSQKKKGKPKKTVIMQIGLRL